MSVNFMAEDTAVILEPKNIKSVTVSIFFPICHGMMGPDDMILFF